MNITHFQAETDIVVIGSNPEMADYDNPSGHIHGHAAYVLAVYDSGDTKVKHVATSRWVSEVLPKAERMAAALNVQLAHGKLPVDFDAWTEGRAIYGSSAWEAARIRARAGRV